ncbi:uncharacterized protein I303_100604 [Kwoniella dejecticola CBS 10117]|uniref:Syntaxin n=1 Tax=Kwoniella dejecticola CBS 10117 TaxID=1296121 RepID=A0A1A6AFE3_9TREE|nr:uncharacterized protein I303_00607 [Kwoniella dejecticola CBS 10117]OBR88790.1 hypothetical protein I303_00607 [Kwoniella dejecticola CBS 10117]
MSDIQSIKIISTEVVDTPKSHVVYVIQISTPIRAWTVSRRFSDFIALNAELKSTVGKDPPGHLPAKSWSLIKGVGDEKLIHERRIVLEQYLSLILTSKDSSWRDAYGFKDFLSVPSHSNLSNHGPSSSSSTSTTTMTTTKYTSQSWLIEHSSLQTLLRSARSALLKRDALAGMGDSVGSRSSSIEAKKILKDLSSRIDILENALGGLALGEGEKKRREEMIDQLRVEKNSLGKMAEVGVRTNLTSSGFSRASASEASNHGSGFSNSSNTTAGGSMNSIPGGFPSNNGGVGVGRVFGAKSPQPPQETAETRPLDDRGLMQLQATKMEDQDDQLKELSRVLQRQKQMGEEIHQEIGEQNEILDEIESGVDKTGRKLGKAKRQLNRLG